VTDQEIFELVAAGERRGVEFKGPRPRTSRQQLAEVARAVLGLTNTRDGGLVLVGVSDAREIQGLSAGDADTWRRADDVRASLARFADPFVQVDTELITIAAAGPAQGRMVAVLTVHEFEITPVLCADQVLAAGGAEILRRGACYVRSNRMPATTEIADHAHLRELLDLAVEKGVREFLRRARAAGLQANAAALITDAERFAAQRARAFDE
jgi:predicted HTH transcriptional regulator